MVCGTCRGGLDFTGGERENIESGGKCRVEYRVIRE